MSGAESLVGGALLGAVISELLKAILGLAEKAIHFNDVLKDITSQLEFLSSIIKQLEELKSDFIDCPQNTNNLGELMNKGKQLIFNCDALNGSKLLKYPKAPFYTRKLLNFDAELQRESSRLLLQLSVEQVTKLDTMNKKIVAQKIMGTNCSCSVHTSANHASPETKLPLLYYHDKQFKGKTGPNSTTDALLGRVVEHMKEKDIGSKEGKTSRKIKKLGEGRYEKILHRTFETVAQEKLVNWFRCDLLTEAAPLAGVLFVSTAKLAFCSHKNIPHHNTKCLYLKVVVPFQLLKGVGMNNNPGDEDQYIQVVSVDNQTFRFKNFRNYNDAKKCLQEVPVTPPTCSRCRGSL